MTRERKYIVASKYFIAMGRDGFTAFKDPSVEWLIDPDAAVSIQDIVYGAFERSGPNYQEDPKREDVRQKRLAILNTSDNDRDEASGFIKFRPKLDGRIKNEPKHSREQ